jgi:hypothetical protein
LWFSFCPHFRRAKLTAKKTPVEDCSNQSGEPCLHSPYAKPEVGGAFSLSTELKGSLKPN